MVEMTAPTKNAKAVKPANYGYEVDVTPQITPNITATNMAHIQYYCLRNYDAPYI